MNVYLITYDLNSPGQKYNCIKERIESNFNWWKCLNNIFIIESSNSTAEIRDYLSSCIDSNDKLLVIKLATGTSAEAAWSGLNKECSDWLKKALEQN